MIDHVTKVPGTALGKRLQTSRLFKIAEILFLFVLGFAFIQLFMPLAGDDPFFRQLVVAAANVLMIIYVWAGLKLRGENWKHFGLTFQSISWSEGLKRFLLSLLVAALGAAGFLLGSVIMVNITGVPETADMSGYNYLNGHIGKLLLALAGVYIASSFGEEVIYRAFLINRISEIGNNTKKLTVLAIILSSLIFGLVHFAWGPMGMVQTAFMGLVMGICYVKLKKRLWILILAHAYLDTTLLVQLYLSNT